MMKAVVHVRLKSGVLDPQGRAVAEALHGLGYREASRSTSTRPTAPAPRLGWPRWQGGCWPIR
jgi:hypothetical protein